MPAAARLVAQSTLRGIVSVPRLSYVQAGQRHWLATYAANPQRWQSDPCVQLYGQLLGVRDSQGEAFLVAADTLRARSDLPADLRASAGRVQASVLFQQAATLLESLVVSPDAPWPAGPHKEALATAHRACNVYKAALVESSEPGLCREVEPHCPEWPEAVAAVGQAAVEVQKLRAELRLREAYWYRRQAERARAVGEAARKGGAGGLGLEEADALRDAGLPPTVEEEELWTTAAAAARHLVEECSIADGEEGSAALAEWDREGVLPQLRARGQALEMLLLKDLAVACALNHQLPEAVHHLLAALRTRPEKPAALSDASFEQVVAAEHGLSQLLAHSATHAPTQGLLRDTVGWTKELAEAREALKAWRAGT